jgi:hypothetical protein
MCLRLLDEGGSVSFYIKLQKAKDILRDEEGYPYAWTGGETIAEFTDPNKALAYVEENLKDLVDAVFFTGSASLLMNANSYLATKLKEADLI